MFSVVYLETIFQTSNYLIRWSPKLLEPGKKGGSKLVDRLRIVTHLQADDPTHWKS
jgi:hypothetical protein